VSFSIAGFLAAPVAALLIYFVGRGINKKNDQKVEVDKFLVVQTGILTALAILIALGGTFLPERSSWMKWALTGALMTAIVCTAAVLLTMITQQAAAEIDPKARPWIPGVTNAAWIALILLAVCCILIKGWAPEGLRPKEAREGQIMLLKERLPLQSTQSDAIADWGAPRVKSDTELAYKTPEGWIVLCFKDASSPAKSITEMIEVDEDAVRKHCQ
jgi:hypothetical protein